MNYYEEFRIAIKQHPTVLNRQKLNLPKWGIEVLSQ